MKNNQLPRSRIAHRWGIVLGALGVAGVLPLSVAFPRIEVFWQMLTAALALLFVRSLVGYSFPGLPTGKKPRR